MTTEIPDPVRKALIEETFKEMTEEEKTRGLVKIWPERMFEGWPEHTKLLEAVWSLLMQERNAKNRLIAIELLTVRLALEVEVHGRAKPYLVADAMHRRVRQHLAHNFGIDEAQSVSIKVVHGDTRKSNEH